MHQCKFGVFFDRDANLADDPPPPTTHPRTPARSNHSVSVTPATVLVNDARYILTIEYQDAAGNTASQQAITVRFDTSTEAPSLALPSTSSSVLQNFTLRYTLGEPAASGTATVTMTRTGGTADSTAARVIVLADSVLTAATHEITMDKLSRAASSLTGITSVTPATDLVNGGVYSVQFSYQDTAANSPASVTTTGVAFDTVTEAPTLSSPVTNGFLAVNFGFDFTLPEAAQAGTVKIIFTHTGGIADAGSPHLITFATSLETAARHQFSAQSFSSLSSLSQVVSMTSDG